MLEVNEFLEHHGVKGMRWGTRRNTPPSMRKIRNKDVPGHTREEVRRARNRIGEEAVINFNAKSLPKINVKWSDADLKNSKNMHAYRLEAVNKLADHVDDAISNYGGKFFEGVHFEAGFRGNDMQIHLVDDEVKHAETEPFLVLKVLTDAQGRITELVMQEDTELEHTDKTEDFLAHYGVVGMKWGRRRNRRALAKAAAKSRPSDEGAAARKVRAKQKAHGTSALTNHELRTANARKKLEDEFEKLHPRAKTRMEKGEAHIKKFLALAATGEAVYKAFNSPAAKQLMQKGKKHATKVVDVGGGSFS